MKNKKKEQPKDQNVVDHSDEMKRLNRIIGQVEGIRKMLDEQRTLSDVLVQCKAVHSALKAIESRLLKSHLDVALEDIAKLEKRKNREQKVAELEELFKLAS